jgi:phospholipid/cholesterol/gamma-HCH transport system substrate-binding protein
MHEDASVMVATRGPLGEAYFELDVGSPNAPKLKPGQLIHGKEPFRIDQALSKLGRILNSAGAAFEKNPDALPHLIKSIGTLTEKLDKALSENPRAIPDMLQELSETARELHEAAAEVRMQFGPGSKGERLIADAADTAKTLHQQLPGVLSEAKGALHGISALTNELDENDAKRLKLAIQHYEQAGEHLDSLATHADHILAEIDAGKGTIGGLNKDPQIYLDVKALVNELKTHPWRLLWKD